jgi:hypothetical protein
MNSLFDILEGNAPDQADPFYFLEIEAQSNPLPLPADAVPLRVVCDADGNGAIELRLSECRLYAQCLEHVACLAWDAWSCRGCGAYDADPDADEPFRAVAERGGGVILG